MAVRSVPRYCLSCDGPVLAQKQRPNHILHLLLTLLTGGLWVLPWIMMSLPSTARCPHCGSAHTATRASRPDAGVRVAFAGVALPQQLSLAQFMVLGGLVVVAFRLLIG